MSDPVHISPFKPRLPEFPGDRIYWGNLHGNSKALAISNVMDSRQPAPVIILTADSLAVARLQEELKFFIDEQSGVEILVFPDWETLPYDYFSPYQDIISDRLSILSALSSSRKVVIVVPVTTVMHRLIPQDFLRSHSLSLKTGQQLEIQTFRKNMTAAGYEFTNQVMGHGEIAVRGSLLDIFPMGADVPYRIDLFDNEIDSIRRFDPESQRSLDSTDTIEILPAREIALVDEGIARFRASWRKQFDGNPSRCPLYRDVSQGLAPAGIEYYLPLFYQETSTLFDYLADNSLLLLDENIADIAESFWKDVKERYEIRRHDLERPILPPAALFLKPDELFTHMRQFAQIHMTRMAREENEKTANFTTTVPTQLPVDARAAEPLSVLKRYIDRFPGRVLITAESSGRRETLTELFKQHDLKPNIYSGWSEFIKSSESPGLVIAPLEQGAQIDEPALAIICEAQLFGDRVQQRRLRKRKQRDPESIIRNLTELTIGAPIVHEDNGVGRYQGMVTLAIDGIPCEFICIQYAQDDKLYVPISSLDRISRYTGVDPEHAPLHRLGSGQWEKAKRKAARKVHDVAAELLEMYARRAARTGNSFTLEEHEYYAFTEAFPFEETPGQIEAIEDVINDMKQAKPMDRLVCGDSGFGKTEVAMRAAFIAVQNNRQVALLVPTTLLAQQHYQTFRDRFADWPVRIECLSRFRTTKEQEKILNDMSNGMVDIVIGTHKLIQDNIKFKRLGLLIIDEEHRFGVRQKERFKSLRSEIDILTLTATPIPRTLNMALSSLRELSIIATPPSRRLSVKTFVREWNNTLLREALLREIKRGGQVYFVHNRIENIRQVAEEIETLMPEARVRAAHGQMPEKELEQVMLDFYHRRFNVLVCTTIVETGIDVPTANTIIINRADKFGLAQLYQLRGRVGRSHHRAYAYLIVPPVKSMTADAVKRLEAIESLEELGIGFTLATHDLEIRGAGEILGEEQSGQIQEIGFGLYMDLLDRAVRALKAGKHPELDRPLDHGTELDLYIPALIPEDYLPDIHSRLIMYKRIASAASHEELEDLQEEMIDRFGLLPQYLKNLFRITGLKLKVAPTGIRKIEIGPRGGRLYFSSECNVDTGKIIKLVQSQPHIYKFDGNDKLRINKEMPDMADRFNTLENLLDIISTKNAA